jgi:mannose-6-phosphate isomerase-like protein (cupin superfamily)
MANTEIAYSTIDRDNGERFQSLRRDLGVSSFGMNAIVLQPGERGRIHAHEHQEEVYLVLEGELTLVVEGEERLLGPDHLVRVGPPVRRQLVNAGGQRVVLLALGGSGEHAGRDGLAWESWDEESPGRPPQDVPLPQDLPGS